METLNEMYPADWPSCPGCGAPALDGHITCGLASCHEGERRDSAYAESFSQWLDQNNDSLPEPESFSEWLTQNDDTIQTE